MTVDVAHESLGLLDITAEILQAPGPGQQVGVMFQRADDDFVAGLPGDVQAVGQQVDGLGAAAREDDLPAVGGVQPAGQLLAYAFEGLGGALCRKVLGTVHIGGTAAVVVAQGVEHGLRFLCRGRAVQIGLAFVVQGEDAGEVGAPGRNE